MFDTSFLPWVRHRRSLEERMARAESRLDAAKDEIAARVEHISNLGRRVDDAVDRGIAALHSTPPEGMKRG